MSFWRLTNSSFKSNSSSTLPWCNIFTTKKSVFAIHQLVDLLGDVLDLILDESRCIEDRIMVGHSRIVQDV